MLEQYRKEIPTEERNLLPDNDAKMGKRKLLFLLTGSTFALVFFLFLMGAFKTDEASDAVIEEHLVDTQKPATAEQLSALEARVQELTKKIELLERAHTMSAPLATARVEQSQKNQEIASNALQSAEEGIAMTNQALHHLIAQQAASLAPPPAIAKAQAKSKKIKEIARTPTPKGEGKVYVVKKGDTLSKISQRHFGTPNRWKSIYDANRDQIANINQLKVGTSIVIPD